VAFIEPIAMFKPLLAGLAALLLAAHGARAQDWIGSWGAAPVADTAAARFSGQTLRQVVRLSAGGSQVRLRLSNAFGAAPLVIGSAHVALAGPDGAILPGSDRVVTFGGGGSAVIPPGAPLVSDAVGLAVPPLASLAVSLYLPADTGPCTCHPAGLETGYLSDAGDFTGAQAFPTRSIFRFRAFLTEVDVKSDGGGRTIIALGDSLTDGVGSTPDRDRRWPDRLAERLLARDGEGRPWGVVNAGIGANRLLGQGVGQNALARLDRDVLDVPGAGYLVVFEGVNDLGFELTPAPAPDAEGGSAPEPSRAAAALIAGYKQIVARAHLRGLKVYGATITPYAGAFYYSAQGEADRQAVNAWIRAAGGFDGVLDFDAAWRDPAHPDQIQPALQAGDRLHGDDAGYRALGDSIDLNLFR
jgi:lysophospholipase L1-like esterase